MISCRNPNVGSTALGDEIPLEIKIVSVYSYGFVVSWTPFNTSDMDHRKFLGYQVILIFFLKLSFGKKIVINGRKMKEFKAKCFLDILQKGGCGRS